MTEPKTVIVIDVPEHAPAEEASRVLNAPGDSFFLVQVLPVAGGHRAYLRRYKQTPAKADAEAALAELIRDNPAIGINKIQDALRERGFKKGVRWVTATKARLNGTGVTLKLS